MKDDDDLPEIRSHDGTSSNNGKVSNRMVVDATQVNGMHHHGLNDFHVPSSNTAIGTAIDQSGPIVVWVLSCRVLTLRSPVLETL
jgi:hypothetical protein